MPLATATIHEVFKIIGKLIFLAELPGPQITALQRTAMALVDQAVDGDADEFDLHKDICVPAAAAVGTINAALKEVPASARGSIESYLSKYVGPKLNLPAGTLAATVIDMLVAEGMGAETVADLGTIDLYFQDEFGKSLPTASPGSETIPDSWVTSNVV